MEHFKYNRGSIPLEARHASCLPLHRSGPLTGFTLIEMIVVLAIIVVVTAVVITSQSAFNKTLILANTAYDVALSLRTAETYGLGSRTADATANAGYGLHFSRATPDTFTFFADTHQPVGSSTCHPTLDVSSPTARPGNCFYDTNPDETLTTYTMGNGITVYDFCATDASGRWNCNIDILDIVFTRPSPEPIINGERGARACLALTSRQGGQRFVSVAASGAISANAAPCSL